MKSEEIKRKSETSNVIEFTEAYGVDMNIGASRNFCPDIYSYLYTHLNAYPLFHFRFENLYTRTQKATEAFHPYHRNKQTDDAKVIHNANQRKKIEEKSNEGKKSNKFVLVFIDNNVHNFDHLINFHANQFRSKSKKMIIFISPGAT